MAKFEELGAEKEFIPFPRIQSDHRLEMTSSTARLPADAAPKTPLRTAAPKTPPMKAPPKSPPWKAKPSVPPNPQPSNSWEGLPLWQVEAPDGWLGSALLFGDADDQGITDEEHQIKDEIVASIILAELLPGAQRKAPKKPQQAAAATATASAADINVETTMSSMNHIRLAKAKVTQRSEGDAVVEECKLGLDKETRYPKEQAQDHDHPIVGRSSLVQHRSTA